MDAQGYLDQQLKMLPPGRGLDTSPGSMLSQLFLAFADGAARLDARAMALLEEADPRTALELLAHWEAIVGLPDPCTGQPNNVAERRVALWQKYTQSAGQAPADYIAMAAQLGYRVTIDELRTFTCESTCEDFVNTPEWAYAWRVNIWSPDDDTIGTPLPKMAVFTCESFCDEFLEGYGNLNIQCLVLRSKPSHTVPLFAFPPAPVPTLYFDFTTGL